MYQAVLVVEVVRNTTAASLHFDAIHGSYLKSQKTATQNLSHTSYSYWVSQTDTKIITVNWLDNSAMNITLKI